MDPAERNAKQLHNKVRSLIGIVMDSFSAIMEQASIEDPKDMNAVVVSEMTISEETVKLVKGIQDINTLIRQLKELWLSGPLDTLTTSGDRATALAEAESLAEKIGKIVERREDIGEAKRRKEGALEERKKALNGALKQES